jgi:hypothetical protein
MLLLFTTLNPQPILHCPETPTQLVAKFGSFQLVTTGNTELALGFGCQYAVSVWICPAKTFFVPTNWYWYKA